MLFWSGVFNQLCSLAPTGNSPLDILSSAANTHTNGHTLTRHLSNYSSIQFHPYLVAGEERTQSLVVIFFVYLFCQTPPP